KFRKWRSNFSAPLRKKSKSSSASTTSLLRKNALSPPCASTKKSSALRSLASKLCVPAAIRPAYNPLLPSSSAGPPLTKIFSPPSSPPSKPTPPSAKSPTPSAASSASIRNPWSSDGGGEYVRDHLADRSHWRNRLLCPCTWWKTMALGNADRGRLLPRGISSRFLCC